MDGAGVSDMTYTLWKCDTEGCHNYSHAIEMPDNGAENFCGVCGAPMVLAST